MTGGIRTRLRNDIVRLLIVAALGAGAVLGVQTLAAGGHKHAAAGGSGSKALGASAGPAAAGAAPARGTTGKAGGGNRASAGRAVGGSAAAAPVTPKSLARLAVGGRGLTVVFDRPSGALAEQNRAILQGATVALDEVNHAGGIGRRHVRIVQERLDGLTPAALQARLRAAGPSVALVLPCDTDSQGALASAAAGFGALMLAPCDSDPIAARRIPSYWPVGIAANDEAAGLASFLRVVGYGSVYIVKAPGSSYVDRLTRYFSEAASGKKIAIAGQSTVPLQMGGADLTALARSIRAAHPAPSAIFTALYPPYVNRLAAGLRRRGLHQIVAGTSAMDTALTLASGSAVLEDAVFTTNGFLRENGAGGRFANAYRRRYGRLVGGFPGLGYDTIRLLEQAIAKARSSDAAAIQQALAGGISLTGVGLADRSYRNGADHNPVGPVSVSKVFSGGIEPLFTTTPNGSPKA